MSTRSICRPRCWETSLEYPIFICPAGGKNCFFRNGEQETAAAARGVECGDGHEWRHRKVSCLGQGTQDLVAVYSRRAIATKNMIVDFVEKLEDIGCGGICFTVDNNYVSHRERSMRNRFIRVWCEMGGVPRDAQGNLIYKPTDRPWQAGEYPSRPFPTPTWETIQQLRDLTKLPVIIKGILTAEDTEKCVKTGVSAAVVSNHGARQLDHVGATIEALPECVEAAGGKMPVLIDGGLSPRHRYPESARAGGDGRRDCPAVPLGTRVIRTAWSVQSAGIAPDRAGARYGTGRCRQDLRTSTAAW